MKPDDAGVEDALWHLKHAGLSVPEDGAEHPLPSSPLAINDRVVNVTIKNEGNSVYMVHSTAADPNGTGTIIKSYLSSLDLSAFHHNVITSAGEIISQPGTDVVPEEKIEENYSEKWPTVEELSGYYSPDIEGESPYPSSTLDVKDYTGTGIGPLYRNGDLEIINTGSSGLAATLEGTVYVTGNMRIGETNKNFTLDLNNNTIFIEGWLEIGGKCTLIGSGCIIAVGDVDFAPNINSGPDDFIFVMSVEGTMFVHPNGDFYGSLAGEVEVQLQPGGSIIWTDSDEDFNWPHGSLDRIVISTWEVSRS